MKFTPTSAFQTADGIGFRAPNIDVANMTIGEDFAWVRNDSPIFEQAVKLMNIVNEGEA